MSGILGVLIGAVSHHGVKYRYFRAENRKLSATHACGEVDCVVVGDCTEVIQLRASVEPSPPMREFMREVAKQHDKAGH